MKNSARFRLVTRWRRCALCVQVDWLHCVTKGPGLFHSGCVRRDSRVHFDACCVERDDARCRDATYETFTVSCLYTGALCRWYCVVETFPHATPCLQHYFVAPSTEAATSGLSQSCAGSLLEKGLQAHTAMLQESSASCAARTAPRRQDRNITSDANISTREEYAFRYG